MRNRFAARVAGCAIRAGRAVGGARDPAPSAELATARGLQPGLAVRTRQLASVWLAAVAVALIGCGGSSAPVALLIRPATVVGAPGQLVAVHVFARSGDGALQDVTAQTALRSSDEAVAAVEAGGVRVRAAGDAALVARARGLVAWTRIEAADGADVAPLTLEPAALTVAQGHSVQLVLGGVAPDGSPLDLTGAAAFTIDDPRVAALLADGAGRIYGVAPGSVTISASVAGHSATATLQVVPYAPTRKLSSLTLLPRSVQTRIGRPAQLYAAALYDDGTVEDVTARAAWRSAGDAIDRIVAGTILPARGGTSRVTATLEQLSDAVPATIIDIAGTTIRPGLLQLPVGATQSLAFIATFSDGRAYDLTAAADWSSDAPTLARVADGTVKGVADGMTAVHALAFLRSAVAAVTIGSGGGSDGGTGATVVGLAITPPFATVGLGGSQAFSAVASFAGAQIDGSGVATASAAGSYGITARYGGQQAAATLTVTGVVAHPTSLSVTPASLTLAVGDARGLVATAQYDDGTTRDVSTLAQWSSSSAAATVAAGGQLGARQPGNAVITAQLGTLTATSQVTVQPALTGLTVYPSGGASVAAGLSVALTASASYSDGSTLDVTRSASWSTANSAIATVSMGNATGRAVGSTQVTATWNGRAAQTTLTVTAARVTSLTVSGASSVQCQAGNYSYYTATATFTDGTQRDVSTSTASPQVTWQLSGLGSYPGLYATLYGYELYCSSSCRTTCTSHYGYGSITARAMNDDGSTVTSTAWSIQALYWY